MKCSVIVASHVKVTHQRFCQISDDIPEPRELFNKDLLENSLIEYHDNIENTFIPPKLNPKTEEGWQISNN